MMALFNPNMEKLKKLAEEYLYQIAAGKHAAHGR